MSPSVKINILPIWPEIATLNKREYSGDCLIRSFTDVTGISQGHEFRTPNFRAAISFETLVSKSFKF